MRKTELTTLTMEELEEYCINIGEKKFRAKQIFEWIHRGAKSIDEMTNLSINLRTKLKENAKITNMVIERKITSKEDGTRKYLLLLEDDNVIEGVVMKYKHGLTACISSQIGCAMGCTFCASTVNGLVRNLTAGEMVKQILLMQEDVGERISNIVVMGIGEPLHNFKNLISFLKIVNDENGLNIGNRHITISTCGLVPEIKKLADLKIPINLAISLHAANDDIRKTLIPIANKYSIEELLASCRYYLEMTNRRITFEYALIDGVNDGEKDARELRRLLKKMLCHVNLIPINKIEERDYRKSDSKRIKKFKEILEEFGVQVTIRREMGADIDAACGQLRNKVLKSQNSNML
ncbi:MAG: 23S rRNA (adenine(2503)-C(2))-methyltransferase RlmN [Alkaliphilus sp.]|nr:MAG: 23S rRNA (adenine(2503)-C(2))-methyltransferase RlmN [Alkaliphilus sp.]